MNPAIINIMSARQVADYCIQLIFDDGTEQMIDFKPFLASAIHPDIRTWLIPEKFASFRIVYGELVWGDYELCFPILDLYRNDIEHRQTQDIAA